jgi:ApeA N-terminal domain 1
MEAFEDEGVFWLPGNESETVAGRLRFDPIEGATLSLTGIIENLMPHFQRARGVIRLHGVAGRRYLTLDNCFATNTTYDMPGVARQTYAVGLIISGQLFGQDEPLTFDRFAVEFDQLAHWVRRSGVQVSAHAPTDTQIMDHVDITFDHVPDETVRFGDEELKLSSTWALRGDNITETSLLQATQFELRYPAARPLDDIFADIKWLQDLVTLATTAPTVPTEVILWRQDIVRDQPESMPGDPKPQAMNYYAGQIAERVRLKEPQRPERVMFQFETIGGLLTIARWIGLARTYAVVVDSLLSIRYSAGLYAQNRFYNVISAAESFHRLRFSNEVMPQVKFDQRLDEMISQVEKKSRQNWLRMKLRYANEPSLASRLKEMVDYAGSAFAALCADPGSWVTVVTESRNRLTHHDKERKIEFASGDLYFLAESIFMLVMLCLFRECEVAAETLEALGETDGIQFLKSKLDDITTRLNEQVEKIREQEKAERKKFPDAANNEETATGQAKNAQTAEPTPERVAEKGPDEELVSSDPWWHLVTRWRRRSG